MSTLRIPENVLGAFKREFWASAQIGEPEDRNIEAGMQAALAEWGAVEVLHTAYRKDGLRLPFQSGDVSQAYVDDGWTPSTQRSRLITPWTPVDGGQ